MRKKLLCALLCLIPFLQGCGYRHIKRYELSATATVTPHFSSINEKILIPKCLACHPAGDDEGLATYASVLKSLKVGNPEKSDLYTEVASGGMPVGLPSLTDDEVIAIYVWIQNGALND